MLFPSIPQINLSWNELGPEGGKAIAKGIQDSGSLTAADLKYNRLNDEAKQMLLECVKDPVGFDLKL